MAVAPAQVLFMVVGSSGSRYTHTELFTMQQQRVTLLERERERRGCGAAYSGRVWRWRVACVGREREEKFLDQVIVASCRSAAAAAAVEQVSVCVRRLRWVTDLNRQQQQQLRLRRPGPACVCWARRWREQRVVLLPVALRVSFLLLLLHTLTVRARERERRRKRGAACPLNLNNNTTSKDPDPPPPAFTVHNRC